MCDEGYLDLGEYPIPLMSVANFLKSIGRNPITYKNYFLLIKFTFLYQMQVNYFEDIIVTIYTLGVVM